MIDYNSNHTPISNNFIVMNGYFLNDSLNLSRVGGTIGRKNKEIIKELKSIPNSRLQFILIYQNLRQLKLIMYIKNLEHIRFSK